MLTVYLLRGGTADPFVSEMDTQELPGLCMVRALQLGSR